ncbi:MAG: hypothetical protein M3Z03_17610 [Actinomycetota bacterium]|jgi:hypothetical protein|nr:hypothetical protein [Actinomycetota bacterium]
MTGTDEIISLKSIDEAAIEEAVRLIDAGLLDLLHRELVSTDEMSDLLLDVRTLLTTTDIAVDASELVDPEPVGA